MELVALWLIMAFVVAIVAVAKGRSAIAWFLYGLLIWPIALVHAIVSPRTGYAVAAQARAEGRRPCPHCAEPIQPAARICPHCRSPLDADWALPAWRKKMAAGLSSRP